MKRKDTLFFLFIGILICCAFVITVLAIWNNFISHKELHKKPNFQSYKIDRGKKLRFKGYQSGPQDALVYVIMFFDYQCNPCKRENNFLEQIKKKYFKKVSIVYENFPSSMHKYARKAAIAAECARKQGEFLNYHNALFNHQDRLGTENYFKNIAKAVHITSKTRFQNCLNNKSTVKDINLSNELARKLYIRSIPTFIINGTLVSGGLSKEQLDGLVQKALAKAGK